MWRHSCNYIRDANGLGPFLTPFTEELLCGSGLRACTSKPRQQFDEESL